MITVEHLTKWYGGNRAVEDLCFVGEAKGLRGQALENQVFSALSRTGTMDVCRKALGSLSKGYRQRVGIAPGQRGNPLYPAKSPGGHPDRKLQRHPFGVSPFASIRRTSCL